MNRLFVPLNNEAFYWFKNNGKKYELRAYGPRWNEEHVFEGRKVELRRGYSTPDSIKGKIGKIAIGTLAKVFSEIDYKKIIPPAESAKEAVLIIKRMMGNKKKFIAFEIARQME
mgnify:FL=1